MGSPSRNETSMAGFCWKALSYCTTVESWRFCSIEHGVETCSFRYSGKENWSSISSAGVRLHPILYQSGIPDRACARTLKMPQCRRCSKARSGNVFVWNSTTWSISDILAQCGRGESRCDGISAGPYGSSGEPRVQQPATRSTAGAESRVRLQSHSDTYTWFMVMNNWP